MNAKIHCEHRWVHTHEDLHYEVTVRAWAASTGFRFASGGLQVTFGRPVITVLIGGHWMGDEAFEGNPEIAETDAPQYVE